MFRGEFEVDTRIARLVAFSLLVLLVLANTLLWVFPVEAQVTEVTIGALYPLSGDLATFGKANVEALLIALEDVNKWMADNKFPFRFKLEVRDTATDPTTAESLFRTLYGAGVRYFLGPMSSGELGRVMGAMEAAGLKSVIISPSSTSPALAKKDSVYRFPPPDEFQGRVLALLFKADGVKTLIIVYRSDDWGKLLADITKSESEKIGIKVEASLGYDPKSPDFKSLVETVRGIISRLVAAGVKYEEIGLNIISFEEGIDFLVEAAPKPEFSKIKWYGSDGTALSAKATGTPVAAELAATTVWKNTITFGLTDIAVRLFWTIKDKIGYSPDPYSIISYDCLWVLALAIVAAGGPANIDKVAELIPKIVELYVGASGKITLNEFGDRAGSDYAIYTIKEVTPGKYDWRIIAKYDFATDRIVTLEKDPLAEKPVTIPTAYPTIDMTKFMALLPPTPTPTPTPTPAPAISPTLVAVVIVILVLVALAAYFLLRRR